MPSIPPRPRVPATGGAPMATEAPRTVATQDVRDLAARVVASVEGVVVGKHDAVTAAVLTLLAGGHLLVEDVPGTGKTTLAQALARALGVRARRIQFTSDMLPTDVTGVSVFDQTTQAFRFHPGPVFSHVVIGDEVNRATPKTQSALLEAMGEGHVSVDGSTMALPDPFIVLATQNPQDMEGTFPLPEAQRARFMTSPGSSARAPRWPPSTSPTRSPPTSCPSPRRPVPIRTSKSARARAPPSTWRRWPGHAPRWPDAPSSPPTTSPRSRTWSCPTASCCADTTPVPPTP